jgi:hypothetical protein
VFPTIVDRKGRNMLHESEVYGYVSVAVMRAILSNEGMPISRSHFHRWLKANGIPCKRAGTTLLVPALLCLELMKRDKGKA